MNCSQTERLLTTDLGPCWLTYQSYLNATPLSIIIFAMIRHSRKKAQEFAMIVTAREMDCQHIWNAHAGSAREAGVDDDTVDALREEEELFDLPADEEAIVNYARSLIQNHYASRGSYQMALEQFGRQGLIELTMIIGQYSMLAMTINAFDTNLLPDRSEPLLPV